MTANGTPPEGRKGEPGNVRKLVQAVFLLGVHGPYRLLLRTLGPRPAIVLSRGTAFVHWLFTFVGLGRGLRRRLQAILPQAQPGLPVRTALRRFLVHQHQDFAERVVSGTTAGRRYLDQAYRDFDGREHLDAAIAEGRGVIILIFHFGMPQLLFAGLHKHGYDAAPVLFRGGQRYAGRTFEWVARLVRDVSARADEKIGPYLHGRPQFVFPLLVRQLRRGALLGNAGDGALGTSFLEVPFLGGTIRLNAGTAQLAAHSGAPIVPVFCVPEGVSRHRIMAHAPIHCRENTPEAYEKAVRSYVAVFEDYLRRSPWMWETLQRLVIDRHPDGRLRLSVRAVSGQPELYVVREPGAPA
jgi:KDO2-lipid IV(A) lauroyltransferase